MATKQTDNLTPKSTIPQRVEALEQVTDLLEREVKEVLGQAEVTRQAQLSKLTASATLQSVDTRPMFLCLPDGTRVALGHVESFRPYGSRGIQIQMNSGAIYKLEGSATDTPAKQEKDRQAWMDVLSNAVRVEAHKN